MKEEELGKVSGGTNNDGWDGYIDSSCRGLYFDGTNWVKTDWLQEGLRVKFTGNSTWYDDSYYVQVNLENWSNPLYILEFKINRY